MYHLHFKRNLRSFFFILVVLCLGGIGGLLWWANRTGMPPAWRSAIEEAAARKGLNIEIGSLSYLPMRGITAEDIRIFGDSTRTTELSRLQRVVLDMDKTKLARGEFDPIKIELRDATLSLPLDPEHPTGPALIVQNARGTLLMPGSRRLEIRHASGIVAGISVEIDARLIGYQSSGTQPQNPDVNGERRRLISRILAQLERWKFAPDEPPKLRAFIEYDLNHHDSLRARLALSTPSLSRAGHALMDLSAVATIEGNRLTFEHITARDSMGDLRANLEADISSRHCRFDATSTLDLPALLDAWFDLPAPRQIAIEGAQSLTFSGEWTPTPEAHLPALDSTSPAPPRGTPVAPGVLTATGRFTGTGLLLNGIRFRSASTSFSIRNSKVFLQDLHLQRANGELRGKALIDRPIVRLSLDSTLPASVYEPLFHDQPLGHVIRSFTERKNSTFLIRLTGSFDTSDRFDWHYAGSGHIQHAAYQGVPIRTAHCSFTLDHSQLLFENGKVAFDTTDYPLRVAHGGPSINTATLERVRYDGKAKTVEIRGVTGDVWAAPLVRLFNADIANSLEIYRFRQPPALAGDGIIDTTPQGRTDLTVKFASDGAADYQFLGEDIQLLAPAGKVRIQGEKVTVSDLVFSSFDGPVKGKIEVTDGKRTLGDFSWSGLRVPEIAETYGFKMEAGGLATGRIEFTMRDSDIASMDGHGLLALEKAELFSVPVFGPLSPLVSGVLGDRRSGFERAKSAFFNFVIDDGVLKTNDFQTSTKSLIFVGDGTLDLPSRTLDMTMRLNARGLLGLLTLPLKPFYGMFQFRGTGPLSQPKWRNVMFTDPPAETGEILDPPKARAIAEESQGE